MKSLYKLAKESKLLNNGGLPAEVRDFGLLLWNEVIERLEQPDVGAIVPVEVRQDIEKKLLRQPSKKS
ncbi:hypothetical protein ABIC63_003418 [Pseudacidovorax sp. 1753]|uniref:hypothetical protein n=1 Tax=Pseudacidovorax sp. 1753 TaxID=3156419 RepID=UPI003399E440